MLTSAWANLPDKGGNTAPSTTLNIYGHLIPVMQEEAARIMDEIITPIPIEVGEKLDIESSK